MHHTTGLTLQQVRDLNTSITQARNEEDAPRFPPSLGQYRTLCYIGAGMNTPIRKPPHGDLADNDRAFNKQINQIRYIIERTIAQLKTWRILHTDYRTPFKHFATTITAVIGLHFYQLASE